MNPDPSFVPVLAESDLGDHSMVTVEVDGRRIVLVRSNGKIHALDNACPHLGGPLGKGTLQNGALVCPLHHWTFKLATGETAMGAPGAKAAVYPTKVEEGRIFIQWPA